MNLRNFLLVLAFFTSSLLTARGETGSVIVAEMNLARQNPALYAEFIEQLRPQFQGTLQMVPGRVPVRTEEGTRALDDAIRFLRTTSPRAPFSYSPGISRAAAEHCAEQAGGGMSHSGRGWSGPGDRINRYGRWSGTWGENLACGRSSAREIVIALIIDDGLRARKHRKNIFSPEFNVAGAAVGPHATYRTICSIDFAGGYLEAGDSPNEQLVARNF
ncbi:MAG: CAP domain-containing protein [Chthoniobacterales bacterium]